MKYVRTAIGHRVTSNSGGRVKVRLCACEVHGVTPKGYVILRVSEQTGCAQLSEVDREVRGRLQLRGSPWDARQSTLAVKIGRGCAIEVAGLPVGCRADLVTGRRLNTVLLVLAGAFADGYVWAAESVVAGSMLPT